ncbi:MAG: DUF2795 domain-containing protein [Anaerolineae bacterium]
MSSNRGRSGSSRGSGSGGGGSTGSSSSSTGGRVAPPQIRVQKYLKGMEYPASKNDLVSHAKDEGASDDVMGFLQGLPDRDYDSPVAVSRAFGKSR